MHTVTTNTLRVPGSSLYYETRGSGPILLMISGGPTDADIFASVADALAGRYTVVTYDARGNSRSTLDGPSQDQPVELEAEDAHHLLAAVTSEPAFIFGSSGGALVGLELVCRYPDQVERLVAHEPPLTELLPEREQPRAYARDVHATYLRDGVGAGMLKFVGGAGLQKDAEEAAARTPPPDPEAMARMGRNAEHFLAHRFLPISRYLADFAALRAAPAKVVVATGEASAGQLAQRSAVMLAEELHTTLVQFPGDHGGFLTDPRGFADCLDRVLR